MTTYINVAICFVAFLSGTFVLPTLTDKLLRLKYAHMDKSWYLRLENSRQNKGNKHSKRDKTWLENQVRAYRSGKLNKTRAQALYECGAINTIDNVMILQSKKDEAISYSFTPNLWQRTCCGASCASLGIILTAIGATVLNVSLASVIAVLLTSICVCDLRARIIPYQLCGLYAVVSLAWVLTAKTFADIPFSLYVALASAVGVAIIEQIAIRITGESAIGAGDRRLIPIIAFQVGMSGLIAGLLAMCATGLVMAICTLIRGGNRRSYMPFAPPLYAWVIAGTITCVIAT